MGPGSLRLEYARRQGMAPAWTGPTEASRHSVAGRHRRRAGGPRVRVPWPQGVRCALARVKASFM